MLHFYVVVCIMMMMIILIIIIYKLNGSVKEPNILIYFFSMVFYFRCSVYWWKGNVRF